MKIAIVGTINSSMVTFRGPLLKALVDAGYQVFAFTMDYDRESEQKVRELGATPVRYELERTGTNPFRDLKSVYQLKRLFRQHSIDRVFSYFLKPVIYGSIAAGLARVPRCDAMLPGMGYYFTQGCVNDPWKKRIVSKILKYLLRSALKRNQQVVVYNDDDQKELVQLQLARSSQIVRVNGTGIDLAAYPYSDAPTNPVTFLLAARLIGAKGIQEYLDAANMVKSQYPKTRFVLLGETDSSADGFSAERVAPHVEANVVEWPGKVSDIRPWLQGTSVYVLPSYREGVPRSTQEALATGRPVITTDTTGCRETVIHGQNGFLVPARDSSALAERMVWFLENTDAILSMGQASRQLAEERFDVHKINESLIHQLGLT